MLAARLVHPVEFCVLSLWKSLQDQRYAGFWQEPPFPMEERFLGPYPGKPDQEGFKLGSVREHFMTLRLSQGVVHSIWVARLMGAFVLLWEGGGGDRFGSTSEMLVYHHTEYEVLARWTLVPFQSYDIISISETWWEESHSWSAGTEGYWLLRRDRQGLRGGDVELCAQKRCTFWEGSC